MNRSVFLATAAAVVMGLSAPEARAGDHLGRLPWVKDPTEGLAKARREGLPVMLDFGAEW